MSRAMTPETAWKVRAYHVAPSPLGAFPPLHYNSEGVARRKASTFSKGSLVERCDVCSPLPERLIARYRGGVEVEITD